MNSRTPAEDPQDAGEHHELTPEEAAGIRLAMEEADKGELLDHEQIRNELLTELEALAQVRRAG
jgi:predicted transcriptional regulator